MRRFYGMVTVTLIGGGFSSTGQASEHGHHDMCDPHRAGGPLLSVADVNGDGRVTQGDVDEIDERTGEAGDDEEASFLYDRNAGGTIDATDVQLATADIGKDVPRVDTEVARVALAPMRYADMQEAIEDGFVPGTQYFPGHGYHWIREDLLYEPLDLVRPAGLNYSRSGELLAVFYLIVADLYGEPAPEGFDGHEDRWHHHAEVCAYNLGATSSTDDEVLSLEHPLFIDDISTVLGVPWFYESAEHNTCTVAEPILEQLGLLRRPNNPHDVRDYMDRKFHMLHVWVNIANPCGRFAGTHPDA